LFKILLFLAYPDYYKEIKNPMSFATLKKKYLLSKINISHDEISNFYKDSFLIWKNCWKYNTEDSDISETAEDLGKLANKFIRTNIMVKYPAEKQYNSEESHKINSSYSINNNSIPNSKTSHSFIKENNFLGRERINNISHMSKEEKTENLSLLPDEIIKDYKGIKIISDKDNNYFDVNHTSNLMNNLNEKFDNKGSNDASTDENKFPKEEKNEKKLDQDGNKNMLIEDFTRKIEEEFAFLNKDLDLNYIYNQINKDNTSINQIIQDSYHSGANDAKELEIAQKNNSLAFIKESNHINNESEAKIGHEVSHENNTVNDQISSEKALFEEITKEQEAKSKINTEPGGFEFKNTPESNLAKEKLNEIENEILNKNCEEEKNLESKESKIPKKPRYIKSLREKADDLQDDIINFSNRIKGNKHAESINNINYPANAITEINFKRERKPVDYKDRDMLRILVRNSNNKSENSLKKLTSKADNSSNEKRQNINEQLVKSKNILSNNNNNNNNYGNKYSKTNQSNNNDIKKNWTDKSLNGLDPFPETIQKRIPKKPQKYANEEFESENINISGKDRNEKRFLKNKKEIELYNNSINDIIKNIANSGRIIKEKANDFNKKENSNEKNENKTNDISK